MQIVDRGQGPPLVLIPGIQGRWEYLEAAVERLSSFFRVVTFSLCGEPDAAMACDSARGFEAYADQVEHCLDQCGVERAIVCGVSFGGLIALRVAARSPQRVAALVLVSAPGPRWHLRPRHEMYARLPWLFGPLFLAESPWRLRKELSVAFPDRAERSAFRASQLRTLMKAPLSARRMAARARLIGTYDRLSDCARVTCPTLVVHGDPALDHVVHAGQTSEYASLIPGARTAVIEGTGHLGSITKPGEFAVVVHDFIRGRREDNHHSAA